MTTRLLLLLILMISFSAQAELYKWVGPDGKINYSDLPPTHSSRVEKKSFTAASDTISLPYELAQAVKNMPVTLYGGDKCAPCVDGRNFLIINGIPFSEKIVSTHEDIERLKQISGDTQVPVLYIGRNKLLGFSASEWRSNLTQAGYPKSNILPTTYRFSEPQPLMPAIFQKNDAQSNTKTNQNEPPVRDPNGFHF